MDGKMGPLFPKVVPYEKQAWLRLFGGEHTSNPCLDSSQNTNIHSISLSNSLSSQNTNTASISLSNSLSSQNTNIHSISLSNSLSSQNTNTTSIPVLNSLSSQSTDIHLISVLNTSLLYNKKPECTLSEDVCSYCKILCIACKHMFVKIIGETRTTLVSFVSFLNNETCSNVWLFSKKEIGFLQLLLQTHFLCCMSELQKHCTRKKLPKTSLSRKMLNL
jgi:hypothetical protein